MPEAQPPGSQKEERRERQRQREREKRDEREREIEREKEGRDGTEGPLGRHLETDGHRGSVVWQADTTMAPRDLLWAETQNLCHWSHQQPTSWGVTAKISLVCTGTEFRSSSVMSSQFPPLLLKNPGGRKEKELQHSARNHLPRWPMLCTPELQNSLTPEPVSTCTVLVLFKPSPAVVLHTCAPHLLQLLKGRVLISDISMAWHRPAVSALFTHSHTEMVLKHQDITSATAPTIVRILTSQNRCQQESHWSGCLPWQKGSSLQPCHQSFDIALDTENLYDRHWQGHQLIELHGDYSTGLPNKSEPTIPWQAQALTPTYS